MARGICLVWMLSCTSCLSTNLSARRIHQDPGGWPGLVQGESTLGDCLDTLGAPLHVRENRAGAILIYGWQEHKSWGIAVSAPISNRRTAQLQFQRRLEGLDGLVLFFDSDWLLLEIRKGALATVLPPTQDQAQLVE